MFLKLQSLSRWKGNWNLFQSQFAFPSVGILQSLSRWKGNWNDGDGLNRRSHYGHGLQSLSRWKGNWNCTHLAVSGARWFKIAEPIPMKRELKLLFIYYQPKSRIKLQSLSRWKGNWNVFPVTGPWNHLDCRAYPDEKGIETAFSFAISFIHSSNCRAYPDEKGIETMILQYQLNYTFGPIAEPIPMKRELKLRGRRWLENGCNGKIAEPIPMKRELKHQRADWGTTCWKCIAEPIPMKRELKRILYGSWKRSSEDCRAYPDEKGIETLIRHSHQQSHENKLQSLSRWKGNWNFLLGWMPITNP